MAKLSIKDPSVRIKPADQLCSFIASLTDRNEMPANVLQIYQLYSGDTATKKSILDVPVAKPHFNSSELATLRQLNQNQLGKANVQAELQKLLDSDEDDSFDGATANESNDEVENLNATKVLSKSQAKKQREKQKLRAKSRLSLNLNDLKWLNQVLAEKRLQNPDFQVYLHELLPDAKLQLPKNEIHVRDAKLEARCVRLRLEQDARMYNAMTKNVDSSRKQMPEDTIAYQMNQINRQLIAVLQFVFSVAAGFAFGFIGVELMIGGLDFGFRLLLGIICSLVIALAEIYFLAKKLNEEYDLSVEQIKLNDETGQGGAKLAAAEKAAAAALLAGE